jgi:4-amino-4-deoxy-L-arabinose transferase-like glycosyltransferase
LNEAVAVGRWPLRRWSLRRTFWTALAAVLAFRFWLAWWLPLTGDEAYFVTWARAPDLGFYDHPPMVGWMLAALLEVSQSTLVLRLPAILLPPLVAVGIVGVVRAAAPGEADAERTAYAGGLAWLLVPVQVVNVLVTTDTPLVLFSALSMAAFAAAVRRDSPALYAAAGVALGLAFLSKYFAVLVGFAYVVFAVASTLARDGSGRRVWRGIAIAAAAAVPFALVNVAWNYGHCWTNVLFNVYNRHGDAGFVWWRPGAFVAFVVYVSSPILLWQLASHRPAVRAALTIPDRRLLWTLALAPLAVFALIAPVRDIGLHWLLAFTPPLFAAGALALGAGRMLASVKFLAAFSAAHVVLVAIVAAAPIEAFQRLRQYDSIVQGAKADELFAALKPYEGRYAFAADGFSPGAVLSYNAAATGFVTQPVAREPWRRHYVFVLGSTSHHGRHDDILTDARALDGRDILVVRKRPAERGAYERFFRRVELREVRVRGATFHLVLGQGFDFAAYRDSVLVGVRDRYYRVPGYLPQGRCYFCERNFGATTCPAR